MEFRFLGTSDSGGIPVHNCDCLACESYREKGKINLATCGVLEDEDGVILFDGGAEDLANQFDGKTIKGVCLTHFHGDHALGLLRLRYSKDKISCYHPKDEEGFGDLFKHKHSIEYIENTPLKNFEIGSVTITPVPLIHSKNTTGYVIQTPKATFGYLTDCGGIEKEYLEFLQSIEFDHVFIDGCFVPPKKGNHLNYQEATEILDSLKCKNGYFIHQGHDNLEYILKNNPKLKYQYIESGFSIKI